MSASVRFALVALLAAASPAAASPVSTGPVAQPGRRIILKPSPCPGPTCTAAPNPEPNAHYKRTIFLNFEGVTLTSSQTDDDAKNGTSAIVNSASETIQPFSANDLASTQGMSRSQIIDYVVMRMRAMFADFNVEFTTTRPTTGNYAMIVFGGSCESVVGSSGCAGIALLDCGDFLPNNITFAFPPGLFVDDLATTAAQESAHAIGLTHTTNQDDVMYPSITGTVPSGFYKGLIGVNPSDIQQGSNCGMTQQNSHQLMLDTIGPPGEDTLPPSITITSQQNGSVIHAGDQIAADITDDSAIASAELQISAKTVATDTSAPYSFTFPDGVTPGNVAVRVLATDSKGNTGTAVVNLYLPSGNETPCDNTPGSCPDQMICRDSICVPDTGLHNLGETCTGNAQCASMLCGESGGEKLCSAVCSDTMKCPTGFDCNSGACWPTADTGGCGCQASGWDGAGGLLGLLGVALFGLRRRRR